MSLYFVCISFVFFFFQAEDGIRDLVRSRGLGDVYKRQITQDASFHLLAHTQESHHIRSHQSWRSSGSLHFLMEKRFNLVDCGGESKLVELNVALSLIHI
eukprot:TRINITY_DN31215_c0_g1_i1.p1 TRINITY_DN31215_c0_g1~~TRINITY_DN31215_c0_g1_i1.p1  ORF type:complete len:100 (+),score=41.05 TRINITY_DN31215_c0_g1_i1:47-346(+)